MNTKRVIFFDIDGTLVDFNGKMPESTKLALKKAKENGHSIIICTGRCKCDIYPFLLDFGFDGIVSSTGAYVEYHGEVIHNQTMSKHELEKMLEFFDKENFQYGLQGTNQVVITKECLQTIYRKFQPSESIEKLEAHSPYGKIVESRDIIQRKDEYLDIQKAFYFSNTKTVSQVQEELKPEFIVTISSFEEPDEYSGEVTMAGANKSSGMKRLIEKLGLIRSDTIAFGDGPNDLDMLAFAGIGIAMGNAEDVVKSHADIVTKNVGENGIYDALVQLNLI